VISESGIATTTCRWLRHELQQRASRQFLGPNAKNRKQLYQQTSHRFLTKRSPLIRISAPRPACASSITPTSAAATSTTDETHVPLTKPVRLAVKSLGMHCLRTNARLARTSMPSRISCRRTQVPPTSKKRPAVPEKKELPSCWAWANLRGV
jgi:hypothetical protein